MENWAVLGEYLDKETLVKTESILNSNKITFRMKSPESHLHSALGQATSSPFIIEVLQDKLEEARKHVHIEDTDTAVVEVPIEEYSVEELKEIVLNPDDWHSEFVDRAKAELTRVGEKVSDEEVSDARNKKIADIQKGVEPSLTIYYFMWFFAFLGGLLGIISGYFYWRGTTKSLDGNKYFHYTPKFRKNGYRMFIVGIISAIIQISYFFLLD